MNRFFYIVVITILCFLELNAQDDDCALMLLKAQKLYDAGNIEQIPTLLDKCLNVGFNREENLQAYKLLVLSNLFDNNEPEAEKILLSFLKQYPEYQIVSTDPAEFAQLFNKYRTLPNSSIGITGGVNYSNVMVSEYYGTYNLNASKPSYSVQTPGFQFGIIYSKYLTDYFDLGIEAHFMQTGFQYTNKISELGTVKYNETQNRIGIPVFTTFTPFSSGKIQPFLRAGVITSYLLNANASASFTFNNDLQNPRTGNDYSVMSSRNKWSVTAFGGVGVKYRLKRSYIVIDMRYSYAFKLMNIPSKRYADLNAAYYYFYIDNDVTMNNIYLNLSYIYSFYKPKRK